MPYTLAQLQDKVGGEISGDPTCLVDEIATLQGAGSSSLSFLANDAYKKYLSSTEAAVVILHQKHASEYDGNKLIHDNPYMAYALLSQLWEEPRPEANIHPSAIISSSAEIDSTAHVGANAVIGDGVKVGAGCIVSAGVSIGERSSIGSGTRLYPNVVVYHNVQIGLECTVQAGCVIGSDGFGFAPTGQGWQRIAQLGGVEIGDRVEIGANTTIDRGAIEPTIVKDGVILDNQIQIAHNVVIGENTAIAACTAIAGSTTIGKNCIIGGATGIAGHLEIVDGCHITAMTMVIKSLTKPGVYSSGTGVQPNDKWRKSIARLRQLDKMAGRITAIEKRLDS